MNHKHQKRTPKIFKFLTMSKNLFLDFLQNMPVISEAQVSLIHFLVASAVLIALLYYCFGPSCTYLIDFVCYLPPDYLRCPISKFIEHFELTGFFERESIDLLEKVLERSGIGDEACVPITLHELPPNSSFNPAREEIEEVLFTVVKDLLAKHKLSPKSIDILVSNCSIFCPTPAITDMIINKFGLRSNVKSISLSGMGCSAGVLSVSLAKELLKVHKNSLALVLSAEAVTPNGYLGKRKSMLISNTIFRMGGAALLLSNRKHDKQTAKYKLVHLIRTHMGSDDKCYSCVMQHADEDGNIGVSLSKELLQVAANALKINLLELGPRVLPYSEQLLYLRWVICRQMWHAAGQEETYVPNFKKAFNHFCIHAGGRAIIDAIENNLRLQKEDVEASRMTLYRFGNTSASSIWYELCYLEAKGRVKKGDRVWQIAFGSGFKTNSAVWKCISDLDPEERNAWSDRIHLYPVSIPNAQWH